MIWLTLSLKLKRATIIIRQTGEWWQNFESFWKAVVSSHCTAILAIAVEGMCRVKCAHRTRFAWVLPDIIWCSAETTTTSLNIISVVWWRSQRQKFRPDVVLTNRHRHIAELSNWTAWTDIERADILPPPPLLLLPCRRWYGLARRNNLANGRRQMAHVWCHIVSLLIRHNSDGSKNNRCRKGSLGEVLQSMI